MAATKHYQAYPKGEIPIYLAYGFRPAFLIMAPYMIILIVLWSLYYTGILPLPGIEEPLLWHSYNLLFGVGFLGMAAFFLTGLPELFPGTVPIVGKRLGRLMLLWIVAQALFWMQGLFGIAVAIIVNIGLYLYLTSLVAPPVLADRSRRHYGLALGVLAIDAVHIWLLLAHLKVVPHDPMAVMKVALGAFMVLIVVSLRRVNTEAVNEILEGEGSEEIFFARPVAYNLTIFTIALYSAVEFFAPQNRALGWVALAASSASLYILHDFLRYQERFILFKRIIFTLVLIPLLLALGYGALGVNILLGRPWFDGDLLHILTTGVWTLSFYIVMIIVTIVHTGRDIAKERPFIICLGTFFIVLATALRVLVAFYPQMANMLHLFASLSWSVPFGLFMARFFRWLLQPRADNLPG